MGCQPDIWIRFNTKRLTHTSTLTNLQEQTIGVESFMGFSPHIWLATPPITTTTTIVRGLTQITILVHF